MTPESPATGGVLKGIWFRKAWPPTRLVFAPGVLPSGVGFDPRLLAAAASLAAGALLGGLLILFRLR